MGKVKKEKVKWIVAGRKVEDHGSGRSTGSCAIFLLFGASLPLKHLQKTTLFNGQHHVVRHLQLFPPFSLCLSIQFERDNTYNLPKLIPHSAVNTSSTPKWLSAPLAVRQTNTLFLNQKTYQRSSYTGRKWFDCAECHQEQESHMLQKAQEMVCPCPPRRRLYRS